MVSKKLIRLGLHLLLLLPLVELVWQAIQLSQGLESRLGADPGKIILEDLATISVWLLLASLAVTPIRKIFHWSLIQSYRRMLGLHAFSYMTLHILSYQAFLLGWDWAELGSEIINRPYILLGLIAWVICLAMAMTSYKWAMKKLGRNWLKLHQLVYLAAILIIIHEIWQAKSALGEPLIHAAILLVLLSVRGYFKIIKRSRTGSASI